MRHDVFVVHVGFLWRLYQSHATSGSVCVCERSIDEQMRSSRWWAAAHPCMSFLLSELMAVVWINGFVNGREATGRVYSVSIYNRSNMPANQIQQQRERGGEKNTKK